MKPKMIKEIQFNLVGMSFFGDPFADSAGWCMENEIGRLWTRFMSWFEQHGTAIRNVQIPNVMLEVHLEHPQTGETGEFEIFVGVPVDVLEDVPPELLVKMLPAVEFAVFTFRGNEITSDCQQKINRDWLDHSEYEMAYRFGIQYYDHRFKGLDRLEESELDVYVPVRRRTGKQKSVASDE